MNASPHRSSPRQRLLSVALLCCVAASGYFAIIEPAYLAACAAWQELESALNKRVRYETYLVRSRAAGRGSLSEWAEQVLAKGATTDVMSEFQAQLRAAAAATGVALQSLEVEPSEAASESGRVSVGLVAEGVYAGILGFLHAVESNRPLAIFERAHLSRAGGDGSGRISLVATVAIHRKEPGAVEAGEIVAGIKDE